MPIGTFRNSNGEALLPETDACVVWVDIEGTKYPLCDIVKALDTDPKEFIFTALTDIPVGNYSFSPDYAYVVGSNHLSVYIEGLRCVLGVDYNEVGEAGNLSNIIKFNNVVPTGWTVVIRVG